MLNRESAEVQVSKLVKELIPEGIVPWLGATVASRATTLQDELSYSPVLSDGVEDAIQIPKVLLDDLGSGIATCLVDDDSNMTIIAGIPKMAAGNAPARLGSLLDDNGSFMNSQLKPVCQKRC